MSTSFDFRGLVVFELANNHQGSVEHGRKVIREVSEIARRHDVRTAMKFQFRQLDSFIHKSVREGSDNRHISRFLSTRLTRDQFAELLGEVRDQKMLAMCTPFDEESVDLIVDMGFDILKIGSCSAADWPLLEKAASAGLPLIVSTGGLALDQIDDLNSFFGHRGVEFAINHCVSIYPAPENMLNLNQIDMLKQRYPGRVIGWSTHEDPDDISAVQIAVAKGAELFERHVGFETEEINLNAYSSKPEQIDRWLEALCRARTMCGSFVRPPASDAEKGDILSLQRGVYLKEPVKSGTRLTREMVYFAMVCGADQLPSGRWQDGIVCNSDIAADEALSLDRVEFPAEPPDMVIKKAIHEVKALLNEARVVLNSEFEAEFSHHYGIPRFREVGAVLITCVNRAYCKKLIVQLPGQFHPMHYHERKEETFQVLCGVLQAEVEGHKRVLYPGDTCLVQPGVWHSFWTDTGVVFEEISTEAFSDDSFYKDPAISNMKREDRKTVVDHWGRYQLHDKVGGVEHH